MLPLIATLLLIAVVFQAPVPALSLIGLVCVVRYLNRPKRLSHSVTPRLTWKEISK